MGFLSCHHFKARSLVQHVQIGFGKTKSERIDPCLRMLIAYAVASLKTISRYKTLNIPASIRAASFWIWDMTYLEAPDVGQSALTRLPRCPEVSTQEGEIWGHIWTPSYARALFDKAAGMRRVHISGLFLGRWEIHAGHNGICASFPHQAISL
jgi:hypothetical protein